MASRKYRFEVVRDWGKGHIIQVRHVFNARGQMKVWELTPDELLSLYHNVGDYLVANRKDLFPDGETTRSQGIDGDTESLAKDGGLDFQGTRE